MQQVAPTLSPLGVAARRFAVITTSLATLALAVAVFVRPDLWMVEHVVFEGTARADRDVLRHLAHLPSGTPLWRVDRAAVAASVQTHPWIRDATVTVEWPDRVRVVVEEHQVAALLVRDDALYALGRTGDVFVEAARTDLDHPLLTGFTPEVEQRRRGFQRLAAPDAIAIIDGLDARGLVSRSDVSEVAFSPTSGFTVYTRGARIEFAHGELERQLDRLSALVSEGLDLRTAVHVDVAPRSVAILRPL